MDEHRRKELEMAFREWLTTEDSDNASLHPLFPQTEDLEVLKVDLLMALKEVGLQCIQVTKTQLES